MIITSEKNINIAVCTISIFFILSCNNNILSSAALSNYSSKEEDIFGINEILLLTLKIDNIV
jgi:hypothetical protein